MSVPFEKLDDKQKKLVQHEKGPMLVLAGPGTGKTEVLTHRVVYLITQKKLPPDELLAITFSRKAASEMIGRLKKLPGLEETELNVSTLHAHSLGLLNIVGESRKFLVADDESRLLLRDAVEDVGFQYDWKTLRAFEVNIRLSKARNQVPDEVTDPDLLKVYKRYEELLDFNDAVDLDGLVLKVVRASHNGNGSLSFEGHLLVDEYQDINQVEYALIQLLAQKATSLFVVGDDDQSIYGWRGANPKIIRDFKQDFQNGQMQILEQSHRCPGHILKGAHEIVAKDPYCISKSPCSSKGDGTPIHIVLSKSWSAEAFWIVDWIKNYLSKENRKPSDIVILAKSLNLAEFLAEQMRLAKIPATFWRSGGLLGDKDVMDTLAHIRLILDNEDNLALRRCLATRMATGIGDVAVKQLRKLGEKHKMCLWKIATNAKQFTELKKWRSPLEDFVANVKTLTAEVTGLEPHKAVGLISKRLGADQRANVERLRNFAKSLPEGSTMEDLLREINKIRGVDLAGGGPEPETKEEAVAIMSMHSAKGLGYKIVFILGMDQGIMPDPSQDECEQRRLCYVAMTRAKEELFLCHAKMRKGPVARGHSFYEVSRFLIDIPKEHRDVIDKS
jgi:DNA helicase-2/ATP-dependent DNA helicase PcrA